jgi:hypothetical protein
MSKWALFSVVAVVLSSSAFADCVQYGPVSGQTAPQPITFTASKDVVNDLNGITVSNASVLTNDPNAVLKNANATFSNQFDHDEWDATVDFQVNADGSIKGTVVPIWALYSQVSQELQQKEICVSSVSIQWEKMNLGGPSKDLGPGSVTLNLTNGKTVVLACGLGERGLH